MSAAIRRLLPNAITLSRLVLAGAFFAVLGGLVDEHMSTSRQWWGTVAVVLFVVAALTDAVDGWLARRWKVTSVFGRIMDPFVDKVLVIGAFVYLAGPALARPEGAPPSGGFGTATSILPWMVVVVVARELLVTSVRAVVEASGQSFGADGWGKAKMILQSIAAPVSLFVATRAWALENTIWLWLRDGFVWLAVGATAFSVVPYLTRAVRMLAPPADGTPP
ncbi:MAG: CDP-alcohol phosphatidyltransferase family protein [Phycisphaerales bacterium]|nr:CDP-alcohol phosphatidyltransferase family protein [Phycisphaerales bacterium]